MIGTRSIGPAFHCARRWRVLLGARGQTRAGADSRLAPGVSPRLAALILGEPDGRPLSPEEAEALTFRAMKRAGRASCPTATVLAAEHRNIPNVINRESLV